MSEKNERGRAGDEETQQAFLRHTIDLNTELIAQADRLISASRAPRAETAATSSDD
jgi:hypothetical protein